VSKPKAGTDPEIFQRPETSCQGNYPILRTGAPEDSHIAPNRTRQDLFFRQAASPSGLITRIGPLSNTSDRTRPLQFQFVRPLRGGYRFFAGFVLFELLVRKSLDYWNWCDRPLMPVTLCERALISSPVRKPFWEDITREHPTFGEPRFGQQKIYKGMRLEFVRLQMQTIWTPLETPTSPAEGNCCASSCANVAWTTPPSPAAKTFVCRAFRTVCGTCLIVCISSGK